MSGITGAAEISAATASNGSVVQKIDSARAPAPTASISATSDPTPY
ncbi:hypothetical protein [Mycolicibacterium alvei]|nr:hypothetical protein [Mycolicibacterium alvei]MCV7000046.1 hypothetical protein [Mycolicibacterium alvei]